MTGSSVNLRKGAGTSYSTITSVKKGKSFPYLDTKSVSGVDWYQIQYNSSTKAWITSQYSKLVKIEDNTSSSVQITGSTVNIRIDAGTSKKILGTAKKGSTYTYLDQSKKSSDGVVWYAVKYGSSTGWVSSKYAKLISGTATTTATTASTTKATSASETTSSQTTASKTQTTASKTQTTSSTKETTNTTAKTTASTTAQSGQIVTVTGGTVNVRKGAGTKYASIATVKKGKTFPYLGEDKDSNDRVWYKIQYNSTTTAWITSQYSKKSSGTGTTAATTTATTAKPAGSANEIISAQVASNYSSYDAVGIQVAAIMGSDGKIFTWNKGYATKSSAAMSSDHKIRVASISKVALAVNALRLQEQGKLDIEANTGKYWGSDPYKTLTVRHLLTHTTSLKSSLSYKNTKAETLSQLKNADNYSGTFGKTWRYNNYGAAVAGTTLELACGTKLDTYSKENVFYPLGMDASFFSGMIKDTSKLATLYNANNSVSRSISTSKECVDGAIGTNTRYFAGGLTGSAQDICKIFSMLAHDGTYKGTKILTPESVKIIEKKYFDASEYGGSFDQCLALRGKAGYLGQSKLFYHTGNSYGVLALASYNPDTGDAVVVITTGASAARDSQGVYAVCSSITKAVYNNIKNL